ncbi:uncharacterized protein VDAG_02433 [Verticillium dahliae VdLs.17]|uniref:Uncharacterized protein n=1 Tax=Verticillium dahliae (strain VdLs.17 / ATCC MYA-4575 / FGSC 10137) TaxID=498257 RepID=G2WXV1_VERDV|nr:uncharacterized protein VDAG_02433 [Verticillium dahliae VdLs.17]EGY20909.1 hypothetical protein VDAG_02433 [Verticillium dahliae VdLs.17]
MPGCLLRVGASAMAFGMSGDTAFMLQSQPWNIGGLISPPLTRWAPSIILSSPSWAFGYRYTPSEIGVPNCEYSRTTAEHDPPLDARHVQANEDLHAEPVSAWFDTSSGETFEGAGLLVALGLSHGAEAMPMIGERTSRQGADLLPLPELPRWRPQLRRKAAHGFADDRTETHETRDAIQPPWWVVDHHAAAVRALPRVRMEIPQAGTRDVLSGADRRYYDNSEAQSHEPRQQARDRTEPYDSSGAAVRFVTARPWR